MLDLVVLCLLYEIKVVMSMYNSLKITKKLIDSRLKQRRHKMTEGENVIINMTVKDDTNFLSVFSESETPVISSEVADFIENKTMSIPPKEQFVLRIHSDCIDDEEKHEYFAGIREYYTEKYGANKRKLWRNRLNSAIFLALGLLILLLSVALKYTVNSVISSEIIDIIAWVLLWEAIDIGFIENNRLKIKEKYYLSYISMKVEFYPARKSPIKNSGTAILKKTEVSTSN